MSFVTGGSFPASIIPAQKKQALDNNYLNFASDRDWETHNFCFLV